MGNIWYYDFEFLEDGKTIDQISVGLVNWAGTVTYYAGFKEADLERSARDPWINHHVLSKLPPRESYVFWKSRRWIAKEILWKLGIIDGVATDGTPELWADHASYDHVALCQIYGRMIDMPSGMPMYSMDLQQALVMAGMRRSDMPKQDPDLEHHALEDALHLRRCHRWLLGLDQ